MYKLLLAAAALQVLLAVTDCAAHKLTKRRTGTDTRSDVETVCTQGPIDFGIVLDSSSSIHRKDFAKAISFLQKFLDYFDIGTGKEGVRVSIITYGRGIYPQDGFNLTTYNTKEDVIKAVGRIPHRATDYTDTGKAINYMHQVQLAKDVVRPWADKVSIVITDGNSQEWQVTQKAADDAREDRIVIFAVGVGPKVGDKELLRIGGDASKVTKVNTYDQLDSIKELLAKKTCTTRTVPTQQCGESNPSDIYFTFSPIKLGESATAWTTSFISQVIGDKELEAGFRYGVISGSCPDDKGFDLKTYSKVEDYKGRLSKYASDPLPQLMKRLLGGAYSEKSGGRVKSRKVAVIVTNGDAKEAEVLKKQVGKLVAKGVQVFIADPSENGLSIGKGVSLNGGPFSAQAAALVAALCTK